MEGLRVWQGPRMPASTTVRSLSTAELTAEDIVRLRSLLWAAFPPGDEGFSEDDWQHGLGGRHFLIERDGRIVSHAAVVERELHVGGTPLRTGYVEAVATHPDQQRQGLGTAVMREASDHMRATFELGALGTGEHAFYERLGWATWQGRAYLRTPDGPERTPDEEGFIMVLRTPSTPALDLEASISCDWRPGDAW
jgi:aminoglycoside 2'-N-acetyltransferase I